MNFPPSLPSAVAHNLLNVAVVTTLLWVVAAIVTRIPGLDAGTRSRWWSAVAIVPLLAFAATLLAPVALDGRDTNASATVGVAAYGDPLDALTRGGAQSTTTLRSAPLGAHAATLGVPREPLPGVPVAVALWLLVAVIRLARVAASAVGAHRLAVNSAEACLATTARDALAARVAVRINDAIDTPLAIGVTCRTVVVPSQLPGSLSASELRAVVLHEIAHLRRRDDWVLLLERFAAAVLWFHPLVHLALRTSATWREVACDASAARSVDSRTCATALWRSATVMYGGEVDRAALALLSGGTLVGRVDALLHPAAASPRRITVAATALIVLAGATSTAVIVRAPAYSWVLGGGLTVTGSMHTPRASFAAVKMRDGRVLVAGGMIANHDFTRASEIYDPVRGLFEPTGSLLQERTGSTGTLLSDGRVLVAGGWTAHGITASTEIYDPASGSFSRGAPMHKPRAGQTATTLPDGAVLMTGGAIQEGVSTASAELYDPERKSFVETAPLLEARVAHTATLLDDGRVLIAGGLDGLTSLRSTELFDPATRRFVQGPAMLQPRSKHAATLLRDGSVLMTGGSSDNGWRARLDTSERYEPDSQRFIAAAPMHAHRFKLAQGTVRLPDGDVLVAGGDDRAELYNVRRDSFRFVAGNMQSARNLGVAVLLNDGSVLIAGGYDSQDPLPTTETAQRYR